MHSHYYTIFVKNSIVTAYNTIGKQHIVIIGGGMSAEREVSLASSQWVIPILIELGYRVTFVNMGSDISNILGQLKPDLIFNCLHGTYGEDGCIPGLLNIMRIPYTHSGVLTSSILFNKSITKQLLIANNIQVVNGIIVDKADNILGDPLPRPYVIKPVCQGSSVGVHVIFDEDDFNFEQYKFPHGNQIIIEQYIPGRELQVAVLNGKAFGTLEIKPLLHRFYNYASKYTVGLTEHIMPAKISTDLHQELIRVSEKIYHLVRCNGVVRVEFLYNENTEQYYVLELNSHPGMTGLSLCPEILSYNGIDKFKLIEELIRTARFE